MLEYVVDHFLIDGVDSVGIHCAVDRIVVVVVEAIVK